MQCPACRAVYSNGLDKCPRCRTSATGSLAESDQAQANFTQREPKLMANEDAGFDAALAKTASVSSTLIEFPGTGRAARPLWRKELSERVREIQERRSREAALEAQELRIRRETELLEQELSGTALGLVPEPDQPALNPLVAKALKRIERAQRDPTPALARSRTRGTSVAVARVARESFDLHREIQSQPSLVGVDPVKQLDVATESQTPVKQLDVAAESQTPVKRAHTLSVVQTKSVVSETLTTVTGSPAAPISKTSLSQPIEIEDVGILAPGEFYDDYAPLSHRLVAGLIDIFVVLFASSPFAAIIELTNGDWADERVLFSMAGIVTIIMFLYLTTSTSIGGRTWGMSLLSLRAVDVDTGLPPTTKQSVTRAFAYMVSLFVFGLGVLYSLVDAEGRGVHDHISGTAVVRE